MRAFLFSKHFLILAAFCFLSACGSDELLTVGVDVTPVCQRVEFDDQATFTATVFNATDTSVTWSVEGGNDNGTIDADTGVYTAPSTAPSSPYVTVTATSNEDTSKIGQATASVATDCPSTP